MIRVKNNFFNSYPVFFHHHGRPSRFRNSVGLDIKKKLFEYVSDGTGITFYGRKDGIHHQIPKKANELSLISNKITILMISNLEEYGSAARCLEYYGVPYVVVGEEIQVFGGWEKFKKIIEFIPSVDTEYLMLLDTDDVFIVDGIEHFVNNYEKQLGCKMLFNAEAWFFPQGSEVVRSFEESKVAKHNPFKYLNSGVWIANTEFLKSIYQDLISIDSYSTIDQAIFKELYMKYYPDIKIDSGCVYFQSVIWSEWFENYYPGAMSLQLEIT